MTIPASARILLIGTGNFAARIAFDLAATAMEPTMLVIAGRSAFRLAWLATAARARASMFQRPVGVETRQAVLDGDGPADLIGAIRPNIVVQAASLQNPSIIAASGNAWTRLVAEGGLSASAVFQTVLSARVAAAVRAVAPGTPVINCCFPDVVNGIIAAMGLPVTAGIGNIAILAHAFAGAMPPSSTSRLHVLAHYQNLAMWRDTPGARTGPTARVWIDGVEIADVYRRFAPVQLQAGPVIDISGASAVPLILALAHGRDWRGHAPGPAGLPGGYPVALQGGRLELDLPPGLDRDAAIRWNAEHEETSGLIVDRNGRARYTGRLAEMIHTWSPDLAGGFAAGEIEAVHMAMRELRERLLATAT